MCRTLVFAVIGVCALSGTFVTAARGDIPQVISGQVPALVEQFLDIDVTKFQR